MYRVLIVEDNIADLNGIVKHTPWESLNCTVVAAAHTGKEGLSMADSHKPDIIITDISMPEMNGIEMISHITKKYPDVQIIFISCFDDFNFARYAVDYNVSSYLLKPIKIKELENAVMKAKKRIDELKHQNELVRIISENRTLIKEKFLINLLMDKTSDKEYILKQSDFFEINPHSNYHLVIMQIPSDYSPSYSIQESYTYQFYLKNICISRFKNIADCHYTTYNINFLFILIDETNLSIDNLVTELHKIQSEYMEKASEKLNIYISKTPFPLENSHRTFESMYKAITDGIYDTNEQILVMDESLSSPAEFAVNHTDEIIEKLNNLIWGNSDVETFTGEYFDKSVSSGLIATKALCFHIISSLNMILKERNVTFHNIFGDELDVWRAISGLSFVNDAHKTLNDILQKCKHYFQNSQASSTDNKVEIIMQSIQENYDNPDVISITVEKLGISLNYANTLFRKKYNITIFEYLVSFRIAQAKKLLEDPSLMAYEVAQQVGYSSKAYFSTVFKQHTGLTPKEYRLSLCAKSDERNDKI